MPDCFIRYSSAHGPVIERRAAQPNREVAINRPRQQGRTALLAPPISLLLSLGGTICEPPPTVVSAGCDAADWSGIRKECSRLFELRNDAAHDQPIDDVARDSALASLRELSTLGAWQAFQELRSALSR